MLPAAAELAHLLDTAVGLHVQREVDDHVCQPPVRDMQPVQGWRRRQRCMAVRMRCCAGGKRRRYTALVSCSRVLPAMHRPTTRPDACLTRNSASWQSAHERQAAPLELMACTICAPCCAHILRLLVPARALPQARRSASGVSPLHSQASIFSVQTSRSSPGMESAGRRGASR